MSVRCFLNPSEVERLHGLKSLGHNMFTLPGGVRLYLAEERYYFELSDLDEIPPSMEGLVEEISVLHHWKGARREAGIYREGEVEAEVSYQCTSTEATNIARLQVKKIEDAKSLVRKIMTGVIRPVESYEGSQNGKSRQELEGELEAARFGESKLREHVFAFVDKMRAPKQWLWCRKSTVAAELLKIVAKK